MTFPQTSNPRDLGRSHDTFEISHWELHIITALMVSSGEGYSLKDIYTISHIVECTAEGTQMRGANKTLLCSYLANKLAILLP